MGKKSEQKKKLKNLNSTPEGTKCQIWAREIWPLKRLSPLGRNQVLCTGKEEICLESISETIKSPPIVDPNIRKYKPFIWKDRSFMELDPWIISLCLIIQALRGCYSRDLGKPWHCPWWRHLWCSPCDVGFIDLQDVMVVGLGRLTPSFHKDSGSQARSPWRAMCEFVVMKLKGLVS